MSATATDAISGLASLLTSADGGASWAIPSMHFVDGSHSVLIHARDVAGNEVTIPRIIRIDTVPPVAQITFHSNGEVVLGDVRFSGSLVDGTSGPEGGEVSFDEGNTWQSVSMDSGDGWTTIWHSSEVPDGDYTIQMRGRDRAGNIGEVVLVRLTVDNRPSAVSITERWWIWETGQLKVSSNHFPVATIQVTIRDQQNRWPAVKLNFNPGKNSYIVEWDRRFGDGTLAPPGEYQVLAEACDVNGLCGQDTGRIVIPEVATSTATLTPSPTATSTSIPSVTPRATQIMPTLTLVSITPMPEKIFEPAQSSMPSWQFVGLLGLFMVIASASVVDPRPKALERLGETFNLLSARTRDESIENK